MTFLGFIFLPPELLVFSRRISGQNCYRALEKSNFYTRNSLKKGCAQFLQHL